MNPYRQLVSDIARLVRAGKQFPLGGFATPARQTLAPTAPKALIFSPHPDDECIIGGLAVRLRREAGMRIVNVAVTQGSRKDRQAGRWTELTAACEYLGFDLVETVPGGLERISVATRKQDASHWSSAVEVIAQILARERPCVIFFPHDADWNSTHIGTHYLVMDALGRLDSSFACTAVETEFWGAMASPNLMVESRVDDVSEMMTALSFHAGEVERNPYHLLLPAWMQDNVRRGGELVGGQGGPAPDFSFCTLYRLRNWRDAALHLTYTGGRNLPVTASAGQLIG
jgi:LmbE family N-acetylglucosaminyl deacetylase